LLRWHDENGRAFVWRHASATVYTKVIAEVLLQRTRADVVARVFKQFLASFPNWCVLAESSEDELQQFLKPLGLWRRRATALRRFATEMCRRHGRFPKVRTEVESIPAVGQYVANAIFLFAHGQREPLLDVNMARVLERYFEPRVKADIRFDDYLQLTARKVVNCDAAANVNWAILDLAALLCHSRNPRCIQCPLARGCRYRRSAQRGASGD
jgi:A/G-specific adenine glycosylase